MFNIQNGRLTATEAKLDKADFVAIASHMGVTPGFARKRGDRPIAAMQIVKETTEVVTINTEDGSVQATKVAQPGDAIMTRLNKDGTVKIGNTGQPDQWVADASNLDRLYNKLGDTCEYGIIVGGNNEVYFIELPNGGEIIAPWGSVQQTSDGVLQYSTTTNEVYLNEADGFKSFIIEKPVS